MVRIGKVLVEVTGLAQQRLLPKVNRVQCDLRHRAHASARCGTHLRAVITTQTKEKPYCLVGFRGVGGGNRARTCDLTDVNRVL